MTLQRLDAWNLRLARAKFLQSIARPRRVQERLLQSIIRRRTDTEFGRRAGFSGVTSVDSFRVRTPVTMRQDARHDLERTWRGARDVLISGSPLGFRAAVRDHEVERIPVSASCLARPQGGLMRAWLGAALNDHPTVLDGAVLVSGLPRASASPNGLVVGNRMRHVTDGLRGVLARRHAYPVSIDLLPGAALRRALQLRFALACPVTLMIGGSPQSLAQDFEFLEAYSDALIRDVRNGTLDGTREAVADFCQSRKLQQGDELMGDDDEAIRLRAVMSDLEEYAKTTADVECARALERSRDQRGGRLLACDAWPLVLIGCLRAGEGRPGTPTDDEGPRHARPGADAVLARWLDPDERGGVPVRDLGWMSAAAHGQIAIDDGDVAGPLSPHSAFMEFVDVDEMQASPHDPVAWRYRLIDELRPGAGYAVFVTTYGGLYRYETCSVVEVDGTMRGVPCVRFARSVPGAVASMP